MSDQHVESVVNVEGVLKAFAAMVRGGLILLIGDTARHFQSAILSAMDPMTRLVVNLQPDVESAATVQQDVTDLRVAVHCQDPESFLDDVSQHLLNLVVTDEGVSERLTEQITSMLIDGGCWIVLGCAETAASLPDAYYPVNLGSCLLLVKRSKPQLSVRRGGRRARIASEY